MTIQVKCSCGKWLNAPDSLAGKKGKCPACGRIVDIPALEHEQAKPEGNVAEHDRLARSHARSIAESAVQHGPYTSEWDKAAESLKGMAGREAAIPVFMKYYKERREAISEVCDTLANLDTTEAVGPLLEIFRECRPSILTETGSFYDAPTTGIKDTLGPSGCRDDHYPAGALVRIRGSVSQLKQLCSAEELERILIVGSHPYVGTPSDPAVILAIGELGSLKAAGLLVHILMQGDDDEEARQRPARQALVRLGEKAPDLLKQAVEGICTGEWRLRARARIGDVLRGPRAKSPARGRRRCRPHARELVRCRRGGDHDWPLTNDDDNPRVQSSWHSAGHASGWPACAKCGMGLLAFIDLTDQGESVRRRTQDFRSMMRARHQWVLNVLISDWQVHPLSWSRSAEHWLSLALDDPEQALTIPGGYRGMVWPFLRIVGWALWWEGGRDRMREAYDLGKGFSLDRLWHEVGLGDDTWLA